jgi:YjbE family integral membrane protein
VEILTPEFLSALLAIIVIDLALAGDNAIVIALAARSLPAHLQGKAIVWGTVGAVSMRIAMTSVVVWLLAVPGLMAAGGVILVWIAWKLARPAGNGEAHAVTPATTFWGAMKTIVVADAAMGLDNVLAVAGAAHGDFLLVGLGLAISIPIVAWGSTLILKWIERFPAIVHVGVAVLAWTAANMVVSDPALSEYFSAHAAAPVLAYAMVFAVVFSAVFLPSRARGAAAGQAT